MRAQLTTAPVAADAAAWGTARAFPLLNVATSNNAVMANARARSPRTGSRAQG